MPQNHVFSTPEEKPLLYTAEEYSMQKLAESESQSFEESKSSGQCNYNSLVTEILSEPKQGEYALRADVVKKGLLRLIKKFVALQV